MQIDLDIQPSMSISYGRTLRRWLFCCGVLNRLLTRQCCLRRFHHKILFGEERITWTRPVHYALRNEKRLGDIYKVLIDGGADVNSVDYYGSTPLMVAKEYGSSEAIEFLQSRTTLPKRRHNKR